MTRYRFPTIITTATCLVLSAFALWWIFVSYSDYRSPDFTLASAGPIVGTCVESATDDQLKAAKYDKTTWTCSEGSKEELSNLLAVSVHAMYDQHVVKGTKYTGDALAVYDAVISAVQGTDSGYSITREHAYAVLSVIGAPTVDCATIYNVSAEGTLPTSVAPTVVCDADVPTANHVPDVTVDTDVLYTHCATQFSYARSYPTKGTFGIPMVGKEAKPMILPIIATNSTTSWEDRARIVVGTRYVFLLSHAKYPLTPWLSSRLYFRVHSWGYSTIFYVVAMLSTAFFIMDCAPGRWTEHFHIHIHIHNSVFFFALAIEGTVLLLAELTRVDAYYAQNSITEGNKESMREGVHVNPIQTPPLALPTPP